jgi:hypothetical protein
MHRLSITYGKLRKNLKRATARLRSEIELYFPALHAVLELDTRAARHLLRVSSLDHPSTVVRSVAHERLSTDL